MRYYVQLLCWAEINYGSKYLFNWLHCWTWFLWKNKSHSSVDHFLAVGRRWYVWFWGTAADSLSDETYTYIHAYQSVLCHCQCSAYTSWTRRQDITNVPYVNKKIMSKNSNISWNNNNKSLCTVKPFNLAALKVGEFTHFLFWRIQITVPPFQWYEIVFLQ